MPDTPDTCLLRINAALTKALGANAELRYAVTAAREGGRTWAEIATILGTSRQAAIEKYATPFPAPPPTEER